MPSKDFEIRQLLRAYRSGIVSQEQCAQQMDEICGTSNGIQVAATSQPARIPKLMGDDALDTPGALAKLMQPGRTYDRTTEDLGNIVALEHVNVTVPDQEKAGLFYINGLGLTRDPYMMTGPGNMWVNAGRQQFHLPISKPQTLRGHIGIVVPDYDALPRRLSRVAQALGGTRFEYHESEHHIEALCPWGNRIRCFAPNERFGSMAVGIPYIEFDVRPGVAKGIARFYVDIMGAQAAALEDQHGRFACVTAGVGQNLFFRETDRAIPPYDQHHIQIYINDFSAPHRRLAAKGLIIQESDQHQYRFENIVDPESGEVLFTIEHEVRSMKHPLFLRPLVNRNPSQSIIGYTAGEDALNWAAALN